MTYASFAVDEVRAPRTDFMRSERLITVIGAAGFGGLIGLTTAMAIGRHDVWAMFISAAVLLAIVLYPAAANLADASSRPSPGCKLATKMHLAALLAWPLVIHLGGSLFWLVPATALSSLILLASCWTGPSRVVYRISVQSVLVGALAAHLGLNAAMGA